MVEIFKLPFQLFVLSHWRYEVHKESIIIIQKLMVPRIQQHESFFGVLRKTRSTMRGAAHIDFSSATPCWWQWSLWHSGCVHLPAGVTLSSACWMPLAVFVSFQMGKWVDWAQQIRWGVCVWERQLFTTPVIAWLDWCSAWIWIFDNKPVNNYTL